MNPNPDSDERVTPDPRKAEAGRKGGLKRQDNWRRGVKECEWCGKLSADLNEHPCFIAAETAATRMRDRCLEKVKKLRETYRAGARTANAEERNRDQFDISTQGERNDRCCQRTSIPDA